MSDTTSFFAEVTTYVTELNLNTTAMEMTTNATTTMSARGYANSNDSDNADDAIWLLTATYIIFTMQTGKGRGE